MIDKNIILDALRKVKHPEHSADIVNMNMIDELQIKDSSVFVAIKFSRMNDPLAGSVVRNAINAVQSVVGAEIKVDIEKRFQERELEQKEPMQGVKNIIAVASGKGGVGKSTIAANLAVSLVKKGYRVGLIDADIYGPSMPKMFGVEHVKPEVYMENSREVINPVEAHGVKLLSIGFFVDPSQALIWRGPMATSALKQLMEQGNWGVLDFVIVDLPPGTSDVHLTLVQNVPVTGAVIVTTPQGVALADAVKGVALFKNQQIDVPVLGLVENMAWFTPAELPENKYFIFGKDGGVELARKLQIPLLGQIPLVQAVCESGDQGMPAALDDSGVLTNAFNEMTERFLSSLEQRIQLDKTKKVKINH